MNWNRWYVRANEGRAHLVEDDGVAVCKRKGEGWTPAPEGTLRCARCLKMKRDAFPKLA